MRPRSLPTLALATVALAGSATGQETRGPLRAEITAVGRTLDGALRRVSRPSYAALAGAATRGYHLPGIGVVYVVPPRTLPASHRPQEDSETPALRALTDATRRLEQSLKTAATPDQKTRIERSLKVLRDAQSELTRTVGFEFQMTTGPDGQVAVETRRLGEGSEGTDLTAVRRAMDAAGRDLMEQMQEQVRRVHEQAEAFRLDAERARLEAEKDFLEAIERSRTGAPSPPAAPVPPTSPQAELPEAPPLLPAPPWQVFFDFGEAEDSRPAEVVVGEVRQALVRALGVQGRRLRGLAPQEAVIVTVDFVAAPSGGFRTDPEKTLVLRVTKKDLDERGAGRLSDEDFRRRVQVSEY